MATLPTRRKTTTSTTIEVKVGVLGGELRSFVLENESTVEDALASSGFTGHSAKINGVTAEYNEILDGGEVILVVEKVEGGL
jgi:sulfur carrier protein ThiS